MGNLALLAAWAGCLFANVPDPPIEAEGEGIRIRTGLSLIEGNPLGVVFMEGGCLGNHKIQGR